tara:strand:- start:16103 stop:16942 length:840 start_codon:yes stop_codon:yes gene_type:complete
MEKPENTIDEYAVAGYPVDHSLSPKIHKSFAQQTGEAISYGLLSIAPTLFEESVKKFAESGGKGLNITLPYKEAAFELASELGPEATKAKAVNTLTILSPKNIRGDNTDGIGFMRDLTENNGVSLREKHILILGAGGAARGILPPLMNSSLGSLTLANRTVEKANRLVQLLNAKNKITVCSIAQLANAQTPDIVINATSAGVKGQTLLFPPSCINSKTFCYDLSYAPKQTPFLKWAGEQGANKLVQGWGMLVEQAAESFLIWRGIRPDTKFLLRKNEKN